MLTRASPESSARAAAAATTPPSAKGCRVTGPAGCFALTDLQRTATFPVIALQCTKSQGPSVKAILHRYYGAPHRALMFEDVAKPSPTDDEVLVHVRAVALNSIDWRLVRARPAMVRL